MSGKCTEAASRKPQAIGGCFVTSLSIFGVLHLVKMGILANGGFFGDVIHHRYDRSCDGDGN